MKKSLCLCVISVCCLVTILAGSSQAQVPKKVNYQGYLTNAGGTPLNSTVPMTFTIYDAAGTQAWTESQTVAVTNGRYSVMLGANNPMNLTDLKPYYLGVKVGSDPEMTPRQEMTGTLYDMIQGNTVSGGAWSQAGNNIYYNNGNVGIGTTTPTEEFDVNGHVKAGTLTIGRWPADPGSYVFFGTNTLDQANNVNYALLQQNTGRTYLNSPEDLRFRINNSDKMYIANNGNIGIGTINPGAKLHVNGTIAWNGTAKLDYHYPYNEIRWGDNTGWYLSFVRDSDGKRLVNIRDNGNMAVYGKLEATEIKISTAPTADFVFAENYQLMPLSSVEQYVKAEKHLPGIPSAKEIEANGVSVGEMQAKLLQKVEELTLHLITLEKENQALQAKVSELETLVK